MKKYWIYAIFLVVLFAGFVLVEYYQPKPIDWRQTYINKHKIPYGTYILYDLLPDIFPQQSVKQSRLPIFNQLEDKSLRANYLFINDRFEVDSLELTALFKYVKQGNHVFIAAQDFSQKFTDTLHLDVHSAFVKKTDSVALTFTNPNLAQLKKIKLQKNDALATFRLKAGANCLVLGKDDQDSINFVKVPMGKGAFYLHSVPHAFSNYYMVAPRRAQYAAVALSHLPVRPVIWDEYQKQGSQDDDSPLRVLLNHEALSWAYYIALASLFLYIIFQSKRTQRIIPVIEKPVNSTLEFVQVVGNLYFNYRNHKIIADKKINYFLEYIRLHYHEQTNEITEELITKVAAKSGQEETEIKNLFDIVTYIGVVNEVTEKQLWELNKMLEKFYANTRISS